MATDTALAIEKNTVVSMHYTLKDDEGSVIDSSEGQEPLTYLQGAGNIIPGLENELVGKSVGDKVKVRVSAGEGYGEVIPELIQQVDAAMFQGVDDLEAGMIFQVQGGENEPPQRIVVREVEGDQVTIDGNHPLAGVTLNFDVEIVALRDATETELDHGHVH